MYEYCFETQSLKRLQNSTGVFNVKEIQELNEQNVTCLTEAPFF